MKKCLLFLVGFLLLIGNASWAMEEEEYTAIQVEWLKKFQNEQKEAREMMRRWDFKIPEEKKARKEFERKKKEFKKKEVEARRAARKFKEGMEAPKIEVERKKLEAIAAIEEFYLELDGKKIEVSRECFESYPLFKDFLEDFYQEGEKEFVLKINPLLKTTKWAENFTPELLDLFVQICDKKPDYGQEVKRLNSRRGLIPLILFADFVGAEDVLDFLLEQLASRIKDKDFLDLLENENALLWYIIDTLPDGVLRILKELVFPDRRSEEPVVLKAPDFIYSLVVLPDGRLASGSREGTIRIWNLNTGEVKVLVEDAKIVSSLVVLPDGRLASGLKNNTICIWNLNRGKTEPVLEGHSELVYSLVVLPDGRLASGSGDRTIRIWNLNTKKTEQVLRGNTDSVHSLVVLPDGRLASGSDKTIRIWNLNTEETERVLRGHTDSVSSLVVLPDGRLASGSRGGNTIRIWNLNTGETEQVLRRPRGLSVHSLVVLPDGRLASDSWDNTIRIWNLNTGRKERVLKAPEWLFSLVVLPDGRLASSLLDNTISIWTIFYLFENLSFEQSLFVKFLQLSSQKHYEKMEELDVLLHGYWVKANSFAEKVLADPRLSKIFLSLPKKTRYLIKNMGWMKLEDKSEYARKEEKKKRQKAQLEKLKAISAQMNWLPLREKMEEKSVVLYAQAEDIVKQFKLKKYRQKAEEIFEKIKKAKKVVELIDIFREQGIAQAAQEVGPLDYATEILEEIKKITKDVASHGAIAKKLEKEFKQAYVALYRSLLEKAIKEVSTELLLQTDKVLEKIKKTIKERDLLEKLEKERDEAREEISKKEEIEEEGE